MKELHDARIVVESILPGIRMRVGLEIIFLCRHTVRLGESEGEGEGEGEGGGDDKGGGGRKAQLRAVAITNQRLHS